MLYEHLKESLAYELTHYPEDYELEHLAGEIDIERTARRVWRWFMRQDILPKLRTKQEWQNQESIHLLACDWLSMYEPTTKERNN